MYTRQNFKSKKELKAAVDAWNKHVLERDLADVQNGPPPVTYFQPGPFGGNEPRDGRFAVEGPHYPKAHTWYAECIARDGIIISVK